MNHLKILVRLPNWLGDMVMAVGFMQQLQQQFPSAAISVIAKKGIHQLLPFFPATQHQFIFDKMKYKGIAGALLFGREIRKQEHFDLFFCLPDSFSSAVMGWASGAKKRIGYKKELRSFLFTHSYTKPSEVHRVDVYNALLEKYTGTKIPGSPIQLHHTFPKEDYIVVNINSEASSRRLTEQKAVELLTLLGQAVWQKIILIGAPKEVPFVHGVLKKLPHMHIESRAGKTDLPQLAQLLASAKLLLSTDSGPAHLANALGTYTLVLFGAGNERETAPYNSELRTIIRLGQLSCEPCEKNICVRYDTPQCLERLDSMQIVEEVMMQLNKQTHENGF
jgi:heptosyltransferase II